MTTLFKLGSRGYQATVNEFQGQIRVHIRKYTDTADRGKIPTKYGIALTMEEFEELKNVLEELNEMTSVMMLETSSLCTPPDPKLISSIQGESMKQQKPPVAEKHGN